ncbi:MAG: DUF5615 family PIN-like protein [Opitutaceae bacterium]
MLRLLLDEHISPDVADGLRQRQKAHSVVSLAEWESGRFLGTTDELILEAAAAQNLTLVTYDCKTIPPLLKSWAEEGREHGGVIFVDDKTIAPSDFGGLVRALEKLTRELAKTDMSSAVIFLRREKKS